MDSKIKKEKLPQQTSEQRATDVSPRAELWQSFYTSAMHWQSDLKFFEDELNFFRLLIDKNLSLFIDPKNIEETRLMVSHVVNLEKERTALHEQISQHTQHISELLEEPSLHDAKQYKQEQARLEKSFSDFLNQFRSVKTEVFKLTERIVHSEKVKRIISLP